MKNFLLVRHAKSSWSNPSLEDKERPLNARGQRDGPFMAGHCRRQHLIPDMIYSSPATRAQLTARYFHNEFSHEVKAFFTESSLYFGSEADWLHLINEVEETTHMPAFFSHNPTITYFANLFTANITDNIPTCGVVHIISTSDTWQDVDYSNAHVANLYFPKLIKK